MMAACFLSGVFYGAAALTIFWTGGPTWLIVLFSVITVGMLILGIVFWRTRRALIYLGASFVLSLALLPSGGEAHELRCASRETVVGTLNEQYGETRQGVGIDHSGGIVETFASLETGTWTVTVTTAQGMTCVVVAGYNYERLKEELDMSEPL